MALIRLFFLISLFTFGNSTRIGRESRKSESHGEKVKDLKEGTNNSARIFGDWSNIGGLLPNVNPGTPGTTPENPIVPTTPGPGIIDLTLNKLAAPGTSATVGTSAVLVSSEALVHSSDSRTTPVSVVVAAAFPHNLTCPLAFLPGGDGNHTSFFSFPIHSNWKVKDFSPFIT